jgi:hypothetical protein
LDIMFTNCGTGDKEQTTIAWNCPQADGVIAPGAEAVFVNVSGPVSQGYVDRLKAGIQRTYYRFTIQYRDIFGIKRTTGVLWVDDRPTRAANQQRGAPSRTRHVLSRTTRCVSILRSDLPLDGSPPSGSSA